MPHTKQQVVCCGLNPELSLTLSAARVVGYKYWFFFQKGLLPVGMLEELQSCHSGFPSAALLAVCSS